jgi:hypothetical protein
LEKTLDANKDQAMITLTGLSTSAFKWLNILFQPVYDEYSPWVLTLGHIQKLTKIKGWKQLMSLLDCLALCLAWTRTKGPCLVLPMIFGITGTCVSLYNQFGRRILVMILEKHPLSSFGVPSFHKIREYQHSIKKKHPLLKKVWCTMDGLKLKIRKAPSKVKQNMFYHSWQHNHII